MVGSKFMRPSMAGQLFQDTLPASGQECFFGDFYATRSNHSRGCTVATLAAQARSLASGTDANSEGCTKESATACGMYQDCPTKAMPRFDVLDQPPQIPSDPFFRLELTRVDVSTDAPWNIGNELLSFFDTRIAGSILKTNKRKFTLKVCVFLESATCTLKLRIYSRAPGTYLVEFQRRGGAATTFTSVFKEAVRFLQEHHDVSETLQMQEAQRVYPPSEYPGHPTTACDCVSPLFGMAFDCSGGQLQAESAAGLAEMAQDKKIATHLLDADGFPATLKELLRMDQLEVELPTVQLLASIADIPEARNCLSDTEIIQLIKQKDNSQRLNVPVQRQLSHVLDVVEHLPSQTTWNDLSPGIVAAVALSVRVRGLIGLPMPIPIMYSSHQGSLAWCTGCWEPAGPLAAAPVPP